MAWRRWFARRWGGPVRRRDLRFPFQARRPDEVVVLGRHGPGHGDETSGARFVLLAFIARGGDAADAGATFGVVGGSGLDAGARGSNGRADGGFLMSIIFGTHHILQATPTIKHDSLRACRRLLIRVPDDANALKALLIAAHAENERLIAFHQGASAPSLRSAFRRRSTPINLPSCWRTSTNRSPPAKRRWKAVLDKIANRHPMSRIDELLPLGLHQRWRETPSGLTTALTQLCRNKSKKWPDFSGHGVWGLGFDFIA